MPIVSYLFEEMSESVLGVMMIYFVAPLCLCFLFILIKLLKKLWWTPYRVQKLMASQGISGPSYRFLYGSIKEILSMKQEAMTNNMELSHHIFPRILPHYYSWIKLYDMNFLNRIGPQAELVATDLELIKVILDNRDGAFLKPNPLGYGRKLLGYGLPTSDGEKWHKSRKLANHDFHAENLKGMAPAMISSVEMMLERWRNHVGNKEIEVFHEFKLLSSEVISRTAFGSSYLEGESIFNMLMQLAPINIRAVLTVRIPVIRDDVEADRLEQGIRDSIVEIVRKREEKVMSGEADGYGKDFLGSLVNAYRSEEISKKITLDDVVDECKTFYITGQETTSSMLSWTVLLAIHTDWQDKAREEVLESFGRQNPTPNGIARLTTMGMIINESIRLYPPVVNILRKVGRETRLGDLIIPANIRVNIAPLALHHNPKLWGDDAHLFKPQRFAEVLAKATNYKTTAYVPFGYGPRICVGLNFAMNQIKIALSMILLRYKFTVSKLCPLPVSASSSLSRTWSEDHSPPVVNSTQEIVSVTCTLWFYVNKEQ